MSTIAWAGPLTGLVLGMILSLAPQTTRADNWMFMEVRSVPSGCSNPVACINRSSLLLRNMLRLAPDEKDRFLRFLNSVATIRGIEDHAYAESTLQAGSQILHDLPVAEKLVPLINHPGVYFDSTKLDATAESASFSTYVRTELERVGLRILTEEEWKNTPGRPSLNVRYSQRRESAGCIIPFSISVTIKEEVVLVRDPSLKIESTTWSGIARENLANTNYTVTDGLREAVKKLTSDYGKANNV